MINLANRTEYSFRFAYGHLNKVIDAQVPDTPIGICDLHGTWGHVNFEKGCKAKGVKPVFGVELAMVPQPTLKEKQGALFVCFFALTNDGLRQIYELTTAATGNFYYFPRIGPDDLLALTDEVVIATSGELPMDCSLLKAHTFLKLTPATSARDIAWANASGIPPMASSDNYYPKVEHQEAYEVCIGRNSDEKTTAQHILHEDEWQSCVNAGAAYKAEALENTKKIAKRAEVELPRAELVHPVVTQTLRGMCEEAAPKRNIDLSDPVYAERLTMELGLIDEKDYEDYFFLIADIVKEAKKVMLVGPARGSSSGSLVCYLLEITEVDPIPYDLLFERFIDINRDDLPDIDIDFPDAKRQLVFDYIREKYGTECVAQLGTVSKFKAKSTISEVAKELQVPQWEVNDLKDAIIERSSGDSRAAFCIMDTFNELDIGKEVLRKYPEMRIAEHIEQHSRHSGKHAAGIVVTKDPVSWFCSVDLHAGAAQVDKKDAEELNLLKIDALGLRTLSVIEDCLAQIGMTNDELLKINLEDQAAFDVMNDGKFAGVFQFEGYALQSLCHQMTLENFEDVVSITALARPGPLNSGMATEWLRRRMGENPVTYDHPSLKPILHTSLGVVIYQENIMQIAREVGGMSWADVSSLRKAMSKSLGQEFFDQYKKKFLKGAAAKGFKGEQAEEFWDKINTFGSWAFNRCLAWDTEILMSSPNKHLKRKVTIKELYEKYFENTTYYRETHKPSVISLFEDGRCYPENLIKIHKNGTKDCYEYTFSDGSKVKCTKDHKFLIDGEWSPIESAEIGSSFAIGVYEQQDLKNGRGKGHSKGAKYSEKQEGFHSGEGNTSWVNGKSKYFKEFKERNKGNPCKDCDRSGGKMEAHHNDFASGAKRPKDLVWLCNSCHKKRHYEKGRVGRWQKGYCTDTIELVRIEHHGMEETYDIEMPTHHNFLIGNGLITHNSHAVAYGMVSYWCMHLKAHHPLEWAAAVLRHAKSDDQSIKLLRELHHEGYSYVAFDAEKSIANWSVQDGVLIGGLIGVKGIAEKTAADIMKRREAGKELTKGQQNKLVDVETPWDTIFEGRDKWGHIMDNPHEHNINSKLTELKDITQDSDGTFVIIAKLTEKNLRDHNELVNLNKRGGREIQGQSLFLNMTIEDDTDSMICNIDRYKYLQYGKPIIEGGKIGDWYVFKGRNRKGFRKLYIQRWMKLSI